MKYSLVYFDDQIQNIDVYQYLLKEKFDVIGYTDCSNYAEILKSHKPHGLLIDLHMPLMNGIELYNRIQDCPDYNGCPIFFISGDASNETRIRTIQAGGIDFFERSLREDEIILRLLNKIQRYLQGRSIIEIGNLRLDATAYVVTIDDKLIDLTLVEMRLLGTILRALPEGISKKSLLEKLWGVNVHEGKISVNVSNIGLKLWDWNHKIKIRGDMATVQPKDLPSPSQELSAPEKVEPESTELEDQ